MPDASDYLKTPEIQEMLSRVSDQVQLDVKQNPEKYRTNGTLDPWKIEREINARKSTLIEDLTSEANLPDEYLSKEELRERRARSVEGIPEELMPDLPEGWLDP